MSQDASTRPRLLTSSQPASSFQAETFGSGVVESEIPVESYADRLMDDLFGDVERMLDSGVKLPAEPLDQPATSKASKLNSLADLVSPLMRQSPTESLQELEFGLPLPPDEQEYETMLAKQDSAIARSLTQQSWIGRVRASTRSYDRLLLGVGGISIVVTLAVWLLSHAVTRQATPVAAPAQTNTTTTAAASLSDNQFGNYLQQALRAIDQQQAPTGSMSTAVNGVPNTNLPMVPVPGNTNSTNPSTTGTPGNSSRTPTGLSRLYVPVYQVPQNLSPTARPSVAPLPSTNAPAAVRAPVPLSVPGVARTLVGVLELGDRSAALIEINGIAQRYRVGESIATSGWTLVDVSKEQAVIRRNGEVRSVFIGQSF